MNEERFWTMIESAWKFAGNGQAKARRRLALGKLSEEKALDLLEALNEEVVPALRATLNDLSLADQAEFDQILESKLHDGDDLSIRGFIIGAGRAYYEAVSANPSIAIPNLRCWAMRIGRGDPRE